MAQSIPDIEGLLESNDIGHTEDGYEEMVNTLLYLAVNPVNVNTADFDTLKMLFLLSDSQIDQILIFRKKYGNFLHPSELLWVPGISRKDLDNMIPFITFGKQERRDQVITKGRINHELLAKARISFPRQEGYILYTPDDFEKKRDYDRKVGNRFHGPPFGSMLKYKLSRGNRLQAGITFENDPGEGYFTRNQKTGFDFVSAHISVTTERFLRRIILGDFRLQWGQGLVAWGGFASGKSDMAIGNEKSGKGFAAYTSTDENNYLRGIAVSVCPLKNVIVDVFFSGKKTDGNITSADTLAEEDLLSVALYESGYHRNNTECNKKHSLKELTTGVALRWNTAWFKVGMNGLYYDFTPALIPGGRIYQRYNDSGDKRWLASLDYKTSLQGFYLFGETAFSDNGAFATVNGLRAGTSFISGCVLYRRYDKRYVSRYAAGFGEYSGTSNEEGFYCGLDLSPVRNLKLNLYYDWFHFFSARYGSTIPGAGWELLGEAVYQHKNIEHGFRYKYEIRPEDIKGGLSVQRAKSEYRYQFGYQSGLLELRTRFSVTQYHKHLVREHGFMVYQDVIYTTRRSNFKMQCRLGWFDTDSYQSRIYAYENNVLYGYSFPAFMGEGWRTYLNLNWKPARRVTCYLKSGFTIYTDRESISSGVTQVKGNRLYDITLQVRVKF